MIYLACPYSHENDTIRELRYKIVTKIAAVMVKDGETVFSPVTNGVALSQEVKMPSDFDFWEDYCIEFVCMSDKMIIVMLDGWEESKGVNAEIDCMIQCLSKFCDSRKIEYIDPIDTKWGVLSLVLHHNLLVKKEQK